MGTTDDVRRSARYATDAGMSRIRAPMFFGVLLMCAGIGIGPGSFVGLVLVVLGALLSGVAVVAYGVVIGLSVHRSLDG
ncbi:hypothetical protein E8D34_16645 [Nocardioides sp. GY 10113]|uniref:hypothetical protein n=1 Tax=Nocardioides sp. GY 10113 TaxID=2569761 RepID=UPI0010A76254|nr:hypothetical protein [Nocardioides sp. GY 10113]TIC80389.1 hypothetical protein E8D34_19335 [Nocardioides sp. GY 10113]TIC82450.1 hypothetical protein E8D34_16645 [Nocardioides sp. GY 10113]